MQQLFSFSILKQIEIRKDWIERYNFSKNLNNVSWKDGQIENILTEEISQQRELLSTVQARVRYADSIKHSQ